MPGALEALKAIQDAGLKLALASMSERVFELVAKLNILSYFECIVDNSKISFPKPHPEIFLQAATQLDVSPEFCIGIEDAHAGIAAIKSAQMYAIGVGEPIALNNADEVISSIDHFDISKYLSLAHE